MAASLSTERREGIKGGCVFRLKLSTLKHRRSFEAGLLHRAVLETNFRDLATRRHALEL
jgi:hypothetical protein